MLITSPRDFGVAVKVKRLALGKTQQALSDEAGVSRKWVSDLERGKPKAEAVLILAVFEALGLELRVDL